MPVAPAPSLPKELCSLVAAQILQRAAVKIHSSNLGGEIWSSEHGLSGIVNKIIITPNFFHGGEHHYPLAKLLRDPWANAWRLIYHSCHNYEKHCPFPGTQKLCLRGCIVWQEDGLASDRSKFKAEPSLTVCVIMGKAT